MGKSSIRKRRRTGSEVEGKETEFRKRQKNEKGRGGIEKERGKLPVKQQRRGKGSGIEENVTGRGEGS